MCVVLLSALASCGGGSNGPGPSPGPAGPVVSSVSPAAGPTSGGTRITISGANFAAGATVSVAGVAAGSVTVQSSSSLTAITGPNNAGVGDVAVTVAGRAGTLSGGFTYANPGPANNPAPVITGLITQSFRPKAPPQFADLNEEIAVAASVTDADTGSDDLVYQWSSDMGTLTGVGRSIRWRAPEQLATPAAATIKLVVIERYVTPDGIVQENRVERTTTVHVHDSVKEVGNLAVEFLTDFSQTPIPPEQVVKNFSSKCRGAASELSDVEDNRRNYVINEYSIGTPSVAIGFDGVCGFRARAGDACVSVPVRWEVTVLDTGKPGLSEGTDHVTAIYDTDRWYLCDSDFEARSTSTLLHFKK